MVLKEHLQKFPENERIKFWKRGFATFAFIYTFINFTFLKSEKQCSTKNEHKDL